MIQPFLGIHFEHFACRGCGYGFAPEARRCASSDRSATADADCRTVASKLQSKDIAGLLPLVWL